MTGISAFIPLCSVIFVLTISSSVFCTKLEGDQDISISPLASCDGKAVPLKRLVRECLSQCPKIDQPYIVEKWKIYDKVQYYNDMEIFHCSVYTETWMYDESWLLSRSPGIMTSREKQSTTLDFCVNLMRSKCGGKPCTIMPDHDRTPEYHYASTTRKSYTYGVGSVLKATNLIIEGEEVSVQGIPDHGSVAKYDYGNSSSLDSKDIYIWEVKTPSTGCHLNSYIVSQCLRSNEKLICDSVGVYADLSKKIEYPKCSSDSSHGGTEKRVIFLDQTGLWLEKASGSTKATFRQYLNMPVGTVTESEKEIVNGFNEVIRVKSERDCTASCLSIFRKGLPQDSLLLAGYNFVAYRNNSFSLCTPLYECGLELEIGICSDPPSLKIKCGLEGYWWNPARMFVSSRSHCLGGKRTVTELIIPTSLGSVLVNKSGAYLHGYRDSAPKIIHPIPHTNHFNAHMVSDVVKMMQVNEVTSGVDADTTVSVEAGTPFDFGISWSISHLKDYLSGLSFEIRMIITILLGALIVWTASKVMTFFKELLTVRGESVKIVGRGEGNLSTIVPSRFFGMSSRRTDREVVMQGESDVMIPMKPVNDVVYI